MLRSLRTSARSMSTNTQNHRKTWPLSQDAHKPSGVCSACHAVRQIHLKDGTIHRHGPRNNPCPGSDKPPLSIQSSPAPLPQVSTNTSTSPPSSSSQACAVIASSVSTTLSALPVFTHPLPSGGLIKHIPKSARPACASLLSSRLNSIVTQPNNQEAWRSLLNFGGSILRKPARTGKRHNLTSIIKKRTIDGEAGLIDVRPLSSAPLRKKMNADALLAAAVTAKVEDGNIKAAIRILCSEEKPATDVKASYEKLLGTTPRSSNRQRTGAASRRNSRDSSFRGRGHVSDPLIPGRFLRWS